VRLGELATKLRTAGSWGLKLYFPSGVSTIVFIPQDRVERIKHGGRLNFRWYDSRDIEEGGPTYGPVPGLLIEDAHGKPIFYSNHGLATKMVGQGQQPKAWQVSQDIRSLQHSGLDSEDLNVWTFTK